MTIRQQLSLALTHNKTPFYCYDMQLLNETLNAVSSAAARHNFKVHYALKANPNRVILDTIAGFGLGADCVSGREVELALSAGIPSHKIVLAGVGKSDDEIRTALINDIFSINVESLDELVVINELAGELEKQARIAIRLNPNVDAGTLKDITTGIKENKFGIGIDDLEEALAIIGKSPNLKFTGIHFHIGSQILDMQPFRDLCLVVNTITRRIQSLGFAIEHINLGGGLGVNYYNPDIEPIPNFEQYFNAIAENLDVNSEIHFELGRSIVAQSGTLVSKVLYTKNAGKIKYLILDAGMSELMRPALYKASHKIENLNSVDDRQEIYSIAGPVCESTDSFGDNIALPVSKRGDIMLIRSCGAYGESMANNYNLRKLNDPVYLTGLPVLENNS